MWVKAIDDESFFSLVNSNDIKSFYVDSGLANDKKGDTYRYYAVKFDGVAYVPDAETGECEDVIAEFEVVWGKEGGFPVTQFDSEIEANLFLEELAEKLNAETK